MSEGTSSEILSGNSGAITGGTIAGIHERSFRETSEESP